MILLLADGSQIRGDLIVSATLRSDLAPVPMTLEADIRVGDDSIESQLAQGQIIMVGSGDKFRILKSERARSGDVQGPSLLSVMRITAILDACHTVAYVRGRAIIREQAALSEIYRAAGATIRPIESDFAVPRFCCPVGDTPSFHIARVLQEEGGVVRWRDGRLGFLRLADLLQQEPVVTLPHSVASETDSGFIERHEIPWYFSTDADAGFIFGNRDKPRAARFAPFMDSRRLRNMSSCLLRVKAVKVPLDMRIGAGELVAFADGTQLAVITAAHVWEGSASSGGAGRNYTRLWLGEVES